MFTCMLGHLKVGMVFLFTLHGTPRRITEVYPAEELVLVIPAGDIEDGKPNPRSMEAELVKTNIMVWVMRSNSH